MNLNQITSGTDYAFFPSRGRGEEFRWCNRNNDVWHDNSYYDRHFVYRVKAVRAFSKREEGNKRDTGYVDVFWMTDEGEFKYDENGEYLTKTVRVRDLATLWEDYDDMRDYEQAKRDRQEAERAERNRLDSERYERERQEREARRVERERIEREQREQAENERKLYTRKIEQRYGLPAGSVTSNGSVLYLDKATIDNAMNGNGGIANDARPMV